MTAAILTLQTLCAVGVCACIAWRLCMTDRETKLGIVLAFWALGLAASCVALAPFAPLIDPVLFAWPPLHTPVVLLPAFLLANLYALLATGRYWADGVPHWFQKHKEAHP